MFMHLIGMFTLMWHISHGAVWSGGSVVPTRLQAASPTTLALLRVRVRQHPRTHEHGVCAAETMQLNRLQALWSTALYPELLLHTLTKELLLQQRRGHSPISAYLQTVTWGSSHQRSWGWRSRLLLTSLLSRST